MTPPKDQQRPEEGMTEKKDAEIEKLTRTVNGLLEEVGHIRDVCDEEIKARSAGLPESKLKSLRIITLLAVPRNMARATFEKFSKGHRASIEKDIAREALYREAIEKADGLYDTLKGDGYPDGFLALEAFRAAREKLSLRDEEGK